MIRAVRQLTQSDTLPPILVDSSKGVRSSLSRFFLSDETHITIRSGTSIKVPCQETDALFTHRGIGVFYRTRHVYP